MINFSVMDREYSIVGVDVGGTSICVGLIVGDEMIDYCEAPTNPARDAAEILNTVVLLISKVITPNTIGIGVGVPGLIDVNNGLIYNINNIPSWRNFPIQNELMKVYNIPVFVNNDANCFALGEYIFGQGMGCDSIVAITLGTGVGAGIVVNKHLHAGILGCAGEIGGIAYENGDYEMYCSSKFFDEFYQKSGLEIYELAVLGNLEALTCFNQFGRHLGHLLKTVLFIMAPNRIIIGGSISKAACFFTKALYEEFNQFPYKPILERTTIIFSELHNSAIFGAAALVINDRDR